MENCVKLTIYVPVGDVVPDGFAACTPEETAMVIRAGYSALMEAKSGLREFGQEELAESIRTELRQKHDIVVGELGTKLEKTERDLIVQKELYKTMCGDLEERIESQVARRLSAMCVEREQLHTEILRLREGQKAAGGEIAEQAIKLVHSDLENMRAMLSEKDKQTETLKTMFEKAVDKIDTITQKRAVVSIGKMGEHQFKDLAEKAFRDFEGFELVDVHSVGGQGDFHLKFRDFSVLADSKLYSHKVNSTSRDKIKRDLKKNEHMHFAWLVSLDTTIDKFDKAPFMFEWLSEKKCVCYVNQLMKYEEPSEMLRAVWFACKTLHSIMMDGDSEVEMGKLRERELKVREIAQKLVKNGRERETLMTQFRTNFDKNDELIRDILDGETNALVNESFGQVVTWWNSHVEVGEGESIKSTVLWNQFKKDCGDVENIDASGFKQVLCSFLHESKVVKPKTKGGALEIVGYKIKI